SDSSAQVSTKAGQQVRDAILSWLAGQDGAGFTSRWIANAAGALVATATAIVMALFGAVFRVSSELAAIFLESMEGTIRDNQTAMNDLIAAAMTDLLSVDVSGEDIGPGGDPGAQVQRARQIGGKLHDLLIREFGGEGSGENIDGALAARAFTGFNINFSTRSG